MAKREAKDNKVIIKVNAVLAWSARLILAWVSIENKRKACPFNIILTHSSYHEQGIGSFCKNKYKQRKMQCMCTIIKLKRQNTQALGIFYISL